MELLGLLIVAFLMLTIFAEIINYKIKRVRQNFTQPVTVKNENG